MAEPIKLHPKRTQEPVAKETATGSCHGHAGHDHAEHTHDHGAGPASGAEHRVKDPVCGMSVDPHTAKHRAEHQGRTYYFCSAGCRTKFIEDPGALSRRRSGPGESRARSRRHHLHLPDASPDPAGRAGFVPICGMALEPVLVSAEAGPNHELIDMTRRFWIGLVLSLPVVAMEMGGHLTGLGHYVPRQTSNWIQMALATPVVLWAGWPFFVRGWQSLVTRNLNMFTLIAMGTGVAWGYSVVATLAPGIFPAAFRGHEGAVAVYFEAAAVITVLVLLGQVLELRARESTSGAIRALLDLAPKTARRIRADGPTKKSPRPSAGRRPLACPPRRKGAGRRLGDRGP